VTGPSIKPERRSRPSLSSPPDWGPAYTHLLRTRSYLACLPGGLSAYPDCCSKSSVWKNILAYTDARGLAERLPDELAALVDPATPYGSWFPAVHSFAGHLLLRDCLFPSDEAMYEHFRYVDRKLLSGPLYRVLFAVTSPEMVVHASDRRFGMLFKGISFHTEGDGIKHVRITLGYPPSVMPPLVARLYLIAFEVAVELAGGKHVRGKLLAQDRVSTRYELGWA
jgi:hypothetical protein